MGGGQVKDWWVARPKSKEEDMKAVRKSLKIPHSFKYIFFLLYKMQTYACFLVSPFLHSDMKICLN